MQRERDRARLDRERHLDQQRRARVEEQERKHSEAAMSSEKTRRDIASQKRPLPPSSTHTAAVSRVVDKRPKQVTNSDILVWQHHSCCESLMERALFEGTLVRAEVDDGLIHSCIRDGMSIRFDGVKFYTDGLSTDGSMRCDWWKRLVAGITIDSSTGRSVVSSDGGTGCTRVGIGTFNAVLAIPSANLPSWIPQLCVVRMTRPDKDEHSNDYKYQNASMTCGEVRNAMFASLNNIGPRVYSLAVFSALRPGRTLRFGVVSTMQCARMDLSKSLRRMSSVEDGRKTALACIDLLYKASRIGVAFFDIKSGNILRMANETDADGPDFYRLTDFDPAFFIRTHDRDWRSLLLLNLTLLSAHVYNADYGPVGRGWAETVAPILRQLIQRKDDYDSKWLFLARCANVKFEVPRDTSDFELQRMFLCIGESYFYGEGRRDALTYRHSWKNKARNTFELNDFWSVESNKTSWPHSWSEPDDEPLIKQLVDIALRHA